MKGLGGLSPRSKAKSKRGSADGGSSGFSIADKFQGSHGSPTSGGGRWKSFASKINPFSGSRKATSQTLGHDGANAQGPSASHGSTAGLGLAHSEKQPEQIKKGGNGSKMAKVNNTIKPSAYMRNFVDNHAQNALDGLLDRETGPTSRVCDHCKTESPANDPLFRCHDCYMPPIVCRLCVASLHKHIPFHFVEEWDVKRRFWLRKPLTSVANIVFELGHGGHKCHYSATQPRPMCIVSEHGIHDAAVRFCACPNEATGKPDPEGTQLLREGFWPASWDKPHTAFSICLLKSFALLNTQGNITPYDFYQIMRRKTDNITPSEIADRYREFMTATRTFDHITDLKHHGRKVRDLVYASLATLCPACPQPDMNMVPGWRARAEELRFLDALFYAIDGNFHANLKGKKIDPDDFPLSKGAAYFADEDAFEAFKSKLPPLGPEPSTCHKFEAMGHGPYWGKVSGVVGMFCARHMMAMPGGHVDLEKGERFSNVDFASASGLQRWMDLLLHISAYDINCQYRIHFEERMEAFWKLRDELEAMKVIPEKPFPDTIAGIGKFHALAHLRDCRTLWGFNFLPNSTMVDGEGVERVWPPVNTISNRAREMNPGNRHDTMNHHYEDQNFRRVNQMPDTLRGKYEDASKNLPRVAETLQKLERAICDSLGEQVLEEWKREEREWKEKVVSVPEKKKLHNPYDLPPPSEKSMKAIEEEIKQKFSNLEYGRHLASVIEEGIMLQETKASILESIARYENPDTVKESKQKFVSRWTAWQSRNGGTLGSLIAQAQSEAKTEVSDNLADEEAARQDDSDDSDDDSDDGSGEGSMTGPGKRQRNDNPPARPRKSPIWNEVDAMAIILPSSCPPNVRSNPCLQEAVEIETSLRIGQANDALNALRTHLITSYSFRQHIGQRDPRVANVHSMATRSKRRIFNKEQNVRRAANEYRRAYHALKALGFDLDGEGRFRELKSEHIRPFIVSLADQELGQSRIQPSWIWQNLEFLDTNDVAENFSKYSEAAIKVHWFRMSALRSRWWEEHTLVLEEMRRTVRFFKRSQHDWLLSSEEHESHGRPGHAAYARKQAYRYERLIGVCSKYFSGIPEIDVRNINHFKEEGEGNWVEYVFDPDSIRYVPK